MQYPPFFDDDVDYPPPARPAPAAPAAPAVPAAPAARLGRPPLPPHARRRNRVNVYLTSDQHNKLRALGGQAWVYEQLNKPD
jgi:hypothetical protein